ncbi:MAG: hypothetical protein QOH05_3943, partial [Acetobacteraceae bacterium]|nr:hypothetical protein [Acetobacteraceae bacterium]
ASLVALSRAQREHLPTARWAATVPNGVRPDRFPFRAARGEYAVFLGRMSPDKGPTWAIDAARAAGIPLVMAAKCREDSEVAYFEQAVAPRLGGDVEWIGEVGGRRKVELLAGARCLLFPVDWEEPFGLVMIEAMACGTPTIAYPAGSVPEVIDHGLTGYIVHDEGSAVAAVSRLDRLSSSAIRARFEQRFTARRMAEDYVALYRRMAVKSRPALRVVT